MDNRPPTDPFEPHYTTIETELRNGWACSEPHDDRPVSAWVEVLNSLPMEPQSFETTLAEFVERVADIVRPMCEIEMRRSSRPVLSVDEVTVSSDSRSAARRSVYPFNRRNGTRTISARNNRAQAVADGQVELDDTVPIRDAAGVHVAEVVFRPHHSHSHQDAPEAIRDIANLIAFVAADLAVRCRFLRDRSLPSITELVDIIVAQSSLTSRDKNVLQLLLQGRSYAEVADCLQLSIETVKKHMKKIYDRTRADGLSDLFARFASHRFR